MPAAPILLPARLTGDAVPALHATLRDAAAEGDGPVELDASMVEKISYAGVQLLVSAYHALRDRIVLLSPSEPVVGAFEIVGLFSVLMAMPVRAKEDPWRDQGEDGSAAA